MNQIPWTVLALGIAVGTAVVLVATLLVEHLAKRYPFYARFAAATVAIVGSVAITVVANPNIFEDPMLSGTHIALIAVLGVQIAKFLFEGRRRNVA